MANPTRGAIVVFQPQFRDAKGVAPFDRTRGQTAVVERVRSEGANWTITVRGAGGTAAGRSSEFRCANVSTWTLPSYPKRPNATTVSYWLKL